MHDSLKSITHSLDKNTFGEIVREKKKKHIPHWSVFLRCGNGVSEKCGILDVV